MVFMASSFALIRASIRVSVQETGNPDAVSAALGRMGRSSPAGQGERGRGGRGLRSVTNGTGRIRQRHGGQRDRPTRGVREAREAPERSAGDHLTTLHQRVNLGESFEPAHPATPPTRTGGTIAVLRSPVSPSPVAAIPFVALVLALATAPAAVREVQQPTAERRRSLWERS